MDMMVDIFAEQVYGKIALKKMASDNEDFRLYAARWMGNGRSRDVMEVTGAVFRIAKSGINKGCLSIMMKGTKRTAYVTSAEMIEGV